MIKKIFLLTGIIIFTFTLQAQVAMGKWRTHFAYNLVDQIAQSENKVFAVSEGTLFSIDKRDGSMEFYSKVSGLNGTIISRIEYDEINKILLIIYQDGNIDFFSSDGVKNLPDFYNKQMSANKAVNHILFHDNKAYLSCNFGIITLNMLKMEVQDTYYIGDNASEVKILNTTIQNGNIYAISDTEIFFATASNPHLISYESWSKMTNLPGSGNYQQMLGFGENLILLRGGKLHMQDKTGTWNDLDPNATYTGIVVSGNYLQGYTEESAFVFDKQLAKSQITNLNTIKDGIYDNSTSKFWFAGDLKGVAEYQLNSSESAIKFYLPEGPAVNTPQYLKFAGEKLFVLPGEKWVGPAARPAHVMIYENNKWKNISHKTIEKSLTDILVQDFSSIAIDPDDDKHYYITSASTGIYEFKNDEFVNHYDLNNSNIEKALNLPWYYYQWVDNIVMDSEKNLWFTNDLVQSGVKVLKNNGEWDKFEFSGVSIKQSLGKILITQQNPNVKWVLSRRDSPGITVFDDNGTISTKNDDKNIFRSSFNYTSSGETKTIAPSIFYTMEQDKTGTIWVGTNNGPLLFNNPTNAFNSDFFCTRIIISRNDGSGLGDYLLENQDIRTISIDGANRKWLGTETSGVYLVSENGQETIHHFNTQNSPLPSNSILSTAINPVTGEVFIGTSMGLVSFQSDAAESGNTFENVYAYPNPVRENFSGLITITGLIEKTNVKITDVAGNLVFETTSNGSIATWDGKNKYGQKVSTGVYLGICTSPLGDESTTVKILVIN